MKELQGKVSFTEGETKTKYVKVWKIFSEKLEKVEDCSGFEMDHLYGIIEASQVVLVVNDMPANAGEIRDIVLIPGSGRASGGGNDNPLQYSCLENPMDRKASWATAFEVAKRWRASEHT